MGVFSFNIPKAAKKPVKKPPPVPVPFAPTPKGRTAAHEYEATHPRYAADNTTTPQVAGPPAPSRATAKASGYSPRAAKAETRQKALVNRFVTQAYQQKVTKARNELGPQKVGQLGLEERVERAKREVENLRERLLSHPRVEEANSAGKVVPLKGLQKLHQTEVGQHALEGPKGVSYSKRFGFQPRSLNVGAKGAQLLQQKSETPQGMGSAGRLGARAKQIEHQKSEPSTLEDLGYASIGIPGIGVGADLARLGEAGASAIPKILAEGGAKQLATEAGAKIAAKAASVKGGAEAITHLPSEVLDAIKSAPEAAKGLPDVLKVGAKGIPGAVKGALREAPLKAVSSAGSTVHGLSGIGAVAATQKAGLHTAPGQAASGFLEGTGKALEHHPLEVLKTTARSAPGLITAPASLIEAAAESTAQGSPKPFENTASAIGKGTYEMGKELLSGNPEEVEASIRHKVGLTPFIPVPALLHHAHESEAYGALRGGVRSAVENLRERKGGAKPDLTGRHPTTGETPKPSVPVRLGSKHNPHESYVFRRLGEHIEGHRARQNVALDTTRASEQGHIEEQMVGRKVAQAFRSGGRLSPLHRKIPDQYEGTVGPMAKYGLAHGDVGKGQFAALAEYLGDATQAPIEKSWTDRMGANAGVEHPEILNDTRHQAGVEALRGVQHELTRVRGRNDVAPHRVQNDFTNYLGRKQGLAPVLKDTERVPAEALKHTSPGEVAAALTNEAERLRARAKGLKDPARAASVEAEAARLEQHAKDLTATSTVSREGAWHHYAELSREYNRLRNEDKPRQVNGGLPPTRSQLRELAAARALERRGQGNGTAKLTAVPSDALKSVLEQKKGLYAQLKQYAGYKLENGRVVKTKLGTSSLKPSSRAMKREFRNEQNARAAALGLKEPVYVKDRLPANPNGAKGDLRVERPFPALKEHFKEDNYLARSGEAEASLRGVLEHSAMKPRTRMAMNKHIYNTVNEAKIPVKVDGTFKHVMTVAEADAAKRAGTWPPNAVAVDLGMVKQAAIGPHGLTPEEAGPVLSVATGDEHAGAALSSLPDTLKKEIEASEGRTGRKIIAADGAAVNELKDQFTNSTNPAWRNIRMGANVPTRLILNDPAWVFAQIFAKGIPIASVLGPGGLLHAKGAIKAMNDIQHMDIHSQSIIKSIMGSSRGVKGTPGGAFEHRDPFAEADVLRHSSAGRKVWNLANGNVMGKWDRWNAAKMREFAAAVRANKGFRNWYGGVKGLDKSMRDIVEATKGMTPAKRLDYIGKHPEMARAVQRHINQIGGNWNAFTTMERKIAPFTIFYPWIRYSLDWTFHTFPVNHPVAATALAFLAQRNANELQQLAAHAERLAGNKKANPNNLLADWTAYAEPVTRNANNEAMTNPSGQRTEPGWGVIPQTAITNEPIKAIGGLNPFIAAGISAGTGTDLFTGGELSGKGISGFLKNFGEQTVGELSPWARLGKTATGFRGIGAAPQSSTSRAYEILEGGKTTKAARSVLFPYLKEPAQKTALRNALNSIEQRIFTTGSEAQSKAEWNTQRPTAVNRKEAEKLKTENKKAWEEKEKLLHLIDPGGKYGLVKQSKAEYEHYKASLPPIGGSGNGFGKLGSESSFGEFGSSNAFGGSSKNLPAYHPPASEGLHIPGLSGLSGVTGAISSLLGGTAAQAAEKAPGHREANRSNVPSPPQVAHKVTISGPLTSSQKEFGKELVKLTGLSPKTVGGWMLAEDSGNAATSKQASDDANWLNIGPGYNLGGNPQKAAQYTANLINTGSSYSGIRASVGQGVGAQVNAIRQSPWDGAHYPNGIPVNLVQGSGTAKVPKKVLTRFQAAVTAAHELNSAHLPYVWGGGHVAGKVHPTGGGLDCSGTVSYVLQKMGVKLPGGVVSGEMGHYLKPGPGAVTVFYNSEHTFMKIGDKYFGTSNSNPSGGAGFFPASVGKGEIAEGNSAGAYSVGHVPGLGKKVAVKMGIPLTGSSGSFPGMTLSNAGTVATINPGAATTTTSKANFSSKPIKAKQMSATQRLQLVQQISEGNLTRLGIPGFQPSVGPSTTQLAELGKALEAERLKLRPKATA